MKSNKSQSSTEFAILAGFMILVFIVFFFILQQNMISANNSKADKIAKSVLTRVDTEIKTAQAVSDGYSRVFELPVSPDGMNYSIDIKSGNTNAEVVLIYANREKTLFLDDVVDISSDIQPGRNIITKKDGKIAIHKVT